MLAALLLALAGLNRCALADESGLDLRLRVAWGGGEATSWRGEFSVSNGSLAEVRPLGLEADEPGCFTISTNTIPVRPRSPRSYDGFDVLVRAPLDAILTVQLADNGEATKTPNQIPLSQLVNGSVNVALDDNGNRLSIQRAPGDRIRVTTKRQSLVFSPSEVWDIDVVPHQLGMFANASVRLDVQLAATRTARVLWRDQRELQADIDGFFPEVPGLEIPVPDVEGVYDITLTLSRRGLRKAFVLGKPTIQRKLQIVVLEQQRPTDSSDTAPWRQVAEFDPAQPRWWERMPRLPQWKRLPGIGPGAISNKKSSTTSFQERSLTQLEPGGWQAYPLPTDNTGTPHILEVEYPMGQLQTLGISVLEPNAAGIVAPVGLDSGVDVSAEMAGRSEPGQTARHRLIFWPRTKAPYVLLTNRRAGSIARFGRIRVTAGPKRLAAENNEEPTGGVRLPLAHFDRPLFPEIFCARDALDEDAGRGLDDWLTFYEGGTRLTEYLKHVGYAGACVSVYCEGSAIYPSSLLDATSKYDTGTYFSSGQDAIRKDVLELLLRLFDREGLHLVPALQFTAPLPALEAIIEGEDSQRVGIELVDTEGRRWIDRHGALGRAAPYYNPLDDRVQEAMREIVRELVQRYGHHRSLAGLSIDLSPDSFALLPSAQWGYDQRTIEHFLRETSGDDSHPIGPVSGDTRKLLDGSHRQAWRKWRAEKLRDLYTSLHVELAAARPHAQLFLAGSDLIDAPAIREALRPALPRRSPLKDVLTEMGIDAELYRDHPGIVLLRPQRLFPVDDVVKHAVKMEFNESQQVDRLFGLGQRRGSLFYHETQTLRLAGFDQVSPFGQENTRTWLAPRFSVAGDLNRRRFARSLATLDAHSMFDGGWTVAMGQEESLRGFLDMYRRLPALSFRPRSADQATQQPVTVRTLTQDQGTYIYLVNDSPWPVSAEVELNAPAGCRIQPLSPHRPTPPLIRDHQGVRWVVPLEPYDLLAGFLTAPDVVVSQCSVQLPEHVVPDLRARIVETWVRVEQLKQPPPLLVLENPGFELASNASPVPGWIVASGPGVTARVESSDAYEGSHSLRLESTGQTAWIRSQPFAVPETGRLSLTARVRCPDSENAPKVRLVVEAQVAGDAVRPWRATVGADTGSPLVETWEGFTLPINDLPVAQLKSLRIGFDLLGPGTVWIDDVQLSGLLFETLEQRELNQIVARSHRQWKQARYGDCARALDDYWPQFLREYVPLPTQRMAAAPTTPLPSPPSPPAEEKRQPSVLDRVKRFVPRVPRF